MARRCSAFCCRASSSLINYRAAPTKKAQRPALCSRYRACLHTLRTFSHWDAVRAAPASAMNSLFDDRSSSSFIETQILSSTRDSWRNRCGAEVFRLGPSARVFAAVRCLSPITRVGRSEPVPRCSFQIQACFLCCLAERSGDIQWTTNRVIFLRVRSCCVSAGIP